MAVVIEAATAPCNDVVGEHCAAGQRQRADIVNTCAIVIGGGAAVVDQIIADHLAVADGEGARIIDTGTMPWLISEGIIVFDIAIAHGQPLQRDVHPGCHAQHAGGVVAADNAARRSCTADRHAFVDQHRACECDGSSGQTDHIAVGRCGNFAAQCVGAAIPGIGHRCGAAALRQSRRTRCPYPKPHQGQ